MGRASTPWNTTATDTARRRQMLLLGAIDMDHVIAAATAIQREHESETSDLSLIRALGEASGRLEPGQWIASAASPGAASSRSAPTARPRLSAAATRRPASATREYILKRTSRVRLTRARIQDPGPATSQYVVTRRLRVRLPSRRSCSALSSLKRSPTYFLRGARGKTTADVSWLLSPASHCLRMPS